jgi:Protein of unknown function (DUF3768)
MTQPQKQEAVNTTIAAVPALRTRRIRELNDRFRMGGNGHRVLTAGIEALGQTEMMAVALKVMTFKDFNRDNDPRDEHDFGQFEHNGQVIYWKIDCYAPDLERGSPDPTDPTVTCRVLTIMLASEY